MQTKNLQQLMKQAQKMQEKLEREGKRHPGGRPVGRYKVDPQRVAALRARGLTYGEISAALGISIPTVRKMLAVVGTPRPNGRARTP